MRLSLEPNLDHRQPLRVVGRYAMYGQIAKGGMANVHFGRLQGPVGFSRTVAIKRLHPQFSRDPEFVDMFLDEARVAARIQHPNVVSTLDIVSTEEELFLVMDYVRGESLARLLSAVKERGLVLPEGFVPAVVAGVLHGLHAAHEATDERGVPLKVVHRDVSPQNVLVAVDGVPRVLDFGVAKAAARLQVTRQGQMKGKLSYMSPEQLRGRPIDRRSDLFAAGVLLWESLTGERLYVGAEAREILTRIIKDPVKPPSSVKPEITPQVDALVLRALEKDPDVRFQTAREFAIAIEETMPTLSSREIGEWVEDIAGERLERREAALSEIESVSSVSELSAMDATDPGANALPIPTTPRRGKGTERTHGVAPSSPSVPQTSSGSLASQRLQVSPNENPGADFDDSEEATQLYTGKSSPQGAFSEESTLVFDVNAESEVTSPRHSSQPPGAPAQKRRFYLMVAGVFSGAILLVALLAGTFLAKSQPVSNPVPGPSSLPQRPAGPPAQAQGRAEADVESAQGQGVTPSSLPAVEIDELPAVEPRPVVKKASTARPVRKRPQPNKCARPFFVDQDGIRRIKPGCL